MPSPTRQTGAIRRLSRRGVTAWVLTSGALPGELGRRFPRELPEQCGDQHQDSDESDQLWLPLQHSVNPSVDGQTRGLSRVAVLEESPERGIMRIRTYDPETRPASASGRRPQANRLAYQPLSCAAATPKPDEWMNHPLPR